MVKQFDGVFGNRVRSFTAASKTILRQSLWLMLFLLGWASAAPAVTVDMTGTWTATMSEEVTTWLTLDLAQSGSSVSGTLSSLDTLGISGEGPVNGSISGNTLTFYGIDIDTACASRTITGTASVTNTAPASQMTGTFTAPASGTCSAFSVPITFTKAGTEPTTEIVASGLWNVAVYIPSCSSTEQWTVNFTYANGAYSVTTYTSNGLSVDPSGNCQNTGPQSCTAAGFYLSGQDLLSTSQFQSMMSLASNCADIGAGGVGAGKGIQSVSFTSPDSVSGTTEYGASFQMTRATSTPTSYALAVTNAGTGYGNVTSSPAGISCYVPEPGINYLVAPDCSESFTVGTSVTLTATPASGSTFFGWGGACSGAGSCVVTMDAAREVTAIFKPVPFVATTTSTITATSATISTTVSFAPADLGKTGAVYVTAWTPASGLSALGILSAPMSQALSVTVTNDNPYTGGKINTRQESLAAVLAAADPNAFVLVQLTSSGWQLVENGQLIPYASGVLGDQMSALSILNNTDPANLLGAQFCVGYGTSAAEMVASGRMMPVADIPGSTVATNGSCNVAANPYKGLWWNPAESGWGMSVTQHDTINFVALYTYDQNAQPIWYVMSNCPIVSAGSCTGDIYKVVGGKSPTQPWVALDFVQALSTAGSGTLTFSDTNNGKFDFTLNGVTGSKTIERQMFSSGTAAQALDYTDLWWNANESGWGVALTQDVGMIFATWYTYDAAGLPVWYVASSCPLSGSGCTGDVYRVTGGEALTAAWNGINPVATVGSVSFAFSDSSTGTMSYTIDGVTGSRAITRQPF